MRGTAIFAFCSTLSGLVTQSQADIVYTVGNGSAENRLAVKIEFVAKSDVTELQIPNWAPGSYRYSDNWKNVSAFSTYIDAKDKDTFTVQRQNEGKIPEIVTWRVSAKKGSLVRVAYEVPVAFGDGTGHFSGPSTYMYVVDRKNEKCILNFDFKEGTPAIVGLDPMGKSEVSYWAKNYDVLADNPVTYGAFTLDTYDLKGKKHYIAYRGVAKKNVDRDYVKQACSFIADMQGDFFGNIPYNRYVWHFSVNDSPDGAGGLEHLSSTQISMGSGAGPVVISVYSHEFFHLWNVKRIRSKPLGPFDYTTLPQTGALWWLEGVTDYYAHTLLARYGWYGKNEREKSALDKLYADVVSNVRGVRARKERMEISPYDSSFKVRDAANGRGNSQGLGVSYYNTGWLCGLVLDIEIMDKSDGKYSLDDVEKALWNICREDKPGFEEDEIRKQCVKFGGADLGTLYDQIIMKPGELPVETALKKIGKELVEIDEAYGKVPFSMRTSIEDQCLRITSSEIPELKQGDLIQSVNGKPTTGDVNATLTAALRSLNGSAKAGDTWAIKLKDGREVNIRIEAATRKAFKVRDLTTVDTKQLKLQKLFEAKKRK
jgi:predicted metalloprotease with PDZ domain